MYTLCRLSLGYVLRIVVSLMSLLVADVGRAMLSKIIDE